jgi:peptidoglycan/LPS O-acetylase OafA/YrhL
MDESPRAAGPRRALAFGGIALLVGLALVGMRPSDANDTAHIDAGMVITLAALLTVIAGIHFYGRLGPDEVDDKRD